MATDELKLPAESATLLNEMVTYCALLTPVRLTMYWCGSIGSIVLLLMVAVPFLLCQSFGGFSMFAAALGDEGFRRRVKIYATDVDDDALATARQALYTERQVADVPPELLAKYFEVADGRYVFTVSSGLAGLYAPLPGVAGWPSLQAGALFFSISAIARSSAYAGCRACSGAPQGLA